VASNSANAELPKTDLARFVRKNVCAALGRHAMAVTVKDRTEL